MVICFPFAFQEELVPLNDLEDEDDPGYLASDEELDSGKQIFHCKLSLI